MLPPSLTHGRLTLASLSQEGKRVCKSPSINSSHLLHYLVLGHVSVDEIERPPPLRHMEHIASDHRLVSFLSCPFFLLNPQRNRHVISHLLCTQTP